MRILYIVFLLHAMQGLAMQHSQSSVRRLRSASDSVLYKKNRQNVPAVASRVDIKNDVHDKNAYRVHRDQSSSHCCFELDQTDCDEVGVVLAHMGFTIHSPRKKKQKNGFCAALTGLFCCKKAKE